MIKIFKNEGRFKNDKDIQEGGACSRRIEENF